MKSLQSIARALGGDVVGRQILCPGRGHSRKDRSLSVRLSPSAPDGFVVHSHCGDDSLDAKDYVRGLLGYAQFAPHRREPRPTQLAKHRGESDADDTAKIERARKIWREGDNPRGTIVETYLKTRSLALPNEIAGEAIRFHLACPWRDEAAGRTVFIPAMLGAMRSIASEEITAVHRTRLASDGRKVDRRMLGKASGTAITLCPFSAVGAGLTLGEGIETTLSAWQVGWSNGWATGSVGAIASFPLLAGISALTLLAETDDGGASAKAIDAVGSRYADAGREVTLIAPTIMGDLNDVVGRGVPT